MAAVEARLTLGGLRRDFVRSAFSSFFGIGEVRADLLIALFERQGVPATWTELGRDVNSHRPPNRGAVQESISLLRACLTEESIDFNDDGYFLSEVGLDECREAVREMAEQLAKLGFDMSKAA